MKKLNLGAAIYGLILSIFLLIVPEITLAAIIDEAFGGVSEGSAEAFDFFVRILCAIMLTLGIILLVKDDVSSKAGKILLIIAGSLVILFSTLYGFRAGVVGIVGSSLLLASNKNYNKV